MKMKRVLSVALAAALVLALGAAAYAAWSIHSARQQELRAELQISESNTEGYVEYDVPEAQTEGVTVLSAINDGLFQKVYLNISPVEEDELPGLSPDRSFRWTLEGSDVWGVASPQLPADLNLRYDEIYDAVRTYAYDAGTKTLTMVCHVDTDFLARTLAGRNSVPLRLSVWQGDEELRSFGTAALRPVQEEMRSFDLGGARYYSAELDKELEIVGLELTPVSAVWKLHYEGDAQIHADRDQAKLVEWGALEDEVCIHAQIVFSNGESFSTGGVASNPYENGCVSCFCSWNRAIDIHAVERIVLGDLVLWENE